MQYIRCEIAGICGWVIGFVVFDLLTVGDGLAGEWKYGILNQYEVRME